MEQKRVGNIIYKSYVQEIEKDLGSFYVKLGLFPENDERKEVKHEGVDRLITIRNVGVRSRISRQKDPIKNSDILKAEYAVDRNWLLDSVDPSKNPEANKILKLFKNFYEVGKVKDSGEFLLRNRRICNGMVAIWRNFVLSNPYNLQNRPRTVAIKGFNRYMIDSMQLLKSICAKIIYKDKIIGRSSNNNQ